MTRPSSRYWRAPLIALGLAVLAVICVVLFAAAVNGLTLGLTLTSTFGMVTAAIVASGQARRYAIPTPFVVALAALTAIAFATLDLALSTALPLAAVGRAAGRAALSSPLWTGYALIGLLLFAVTATAVSALASRRGASSREIFGTQLMLVAICLPFLNVVGAAVWFRMRFTGRALPVTADEFLPPPEKPAK